MNLTPNAITVCEKRYLKKDMNGNIVETPYEMFERVANYIASIENDKEKWASTFLSMLRNQEFFPNTPTLINAGRENGNGQLSACFVLPVDDDLVSIFDAVKQGAIIHKGGGGTGYSFSRLRPKNAVVSSTSGIASGPVSFMSVFDRATNEMKQGGVRRGANMGVLRVDHPDIKEFITCKKEEGRFDNFNISVGITDSFMEALEKGEDYTLWHPYSDRYVAKESAQKVWDSIIEGAWANGEPGLIFLDTINRNNPLSGMEAETEATNPCGEQPLPPYGSCNLGSINLVKILKKTSDSYEIDWDRFRYLICSGVRFLDNVVSLNNYPIKEITEYALLTRRIGLGIMGFADMLIMLGIDYRSEEAVEMADKIGAFLKKEAYSASEELYKERGSNDSPILDKLKRRNGALLSIAPTGSLSILADCSSGIEPNFDVEYGKVAVDTTLNMIPPLFKSYLKKGETPPSHFVTMKDIHLRQHLEIQAAFQKHICSGISKTLNAPNSTTKEEVDSAFRYAYKLGVKGVTFYRSGSRKYEALTSGSQTKFGRPSKLYGFTELVKTGLGNIYVTLNMHQGKPRETFITIGKAGNDLQTMCEAIGRLLSLIFKKDMCDPQEIVKQLKGIGGESVVWHDGAQIRSIPDALGQFLERSLQSEVTEGERLICPECQGIVVSQDGCPSCLKCGWRRCS